MAPWASLPGAMMANSLGPIRPNASDWRPLVLRAFATRVRTCATAASSAAPSTTSGASTTQARRSEEHTSELQSLAYLVCRLLLEKKKKKYITCINSDAHQVA